MGLIESGCVEQVVADTALELTAKAGESLLVTGIRIGTPVSALATLTIARATVGVFRVSGTQGNHLFFPTDTVFPGNLLDFLYKKGYFEGYPIPEGESLSISGVEQATSFQQVLYDRYDAVDQKLTSPNGPNASRFLYIAYGQYNTTYPDGSSLYDTAITPVEFPGFPFGEVSPAGKKLTILGLLFSEVAKDSATGTNIQQSQYIRFIRERKTLFDEERKGLMYYANTPANDATEVADGQASGGNLSDVDRREPLMFAEPLVFQSNEELNVYLQTTVPTGVANLAVADAEIGLIIRAEG